MSKFIQPLQPGAAAIIITLAAIVSGAVTTPNVYAQETEGARREASGDRRSAPPLDGNQERLRQQREAMETKRQEANAEKEAAEARLKARQEERLEKLSASQLEICKNREANINNRITRIVDRSTKHLELFNKISERAQAFYVTKGKTLANYDELVADVVTKKLTAETAVATIADTTASFDCEGENPKVTIEEFKTSLKTAIEVLKDYRTSVKNLIVGIKSVTSAQPGDNKSTEATE